MGGCGGAGMGGLVGLWRCGLGGGLVPNGQLRPGFMPGTI